MSVALKKIISFSIFAQFVLFACVDETSLYSSTDYKPEFAVEGWIESGSPAQVIFTRTASFQNEIDTTWLLKHVIHSAKVSVSDGDTTELLRLSTDYARLPPYVYKGDKIVGKEGKTYSLKIEYNNRTIGAETTVPKAVPLEQWYFVKDESQPETGFINIRFQNQSDQFYQIATMVEGEETLYTPCLYGNFPASVYNSGETVEMQINRGPYLSKSGGEVKLGTWYPTGKKIFLKFRTQDKASYNFWTSWQNEILNAQNPVFPAHTNLKSNIDGGVGCWCGFGITGNYLIIEN